MSFLADEPAPVPPVPGAGQPIFVGSETVYNPRQAAVLVARADSFADLSAKRRFWLMSDYDTKGEGLTERRVMDKRLSSMMALGAFDASWRGAGLVKGAIFGGERPDDDLLSRFSYEGNRAALREEAAFEGSARGLAGHAMNAWYGLANVAWATSIKGGHPLLAKAVSRLSPALRSLEAKRSLPKWQARAEVLSQVEDMGFSVPPFLKNFCQRRLDAKVAESNGGRYPFTVESAAVVLQRLDNEAYELMREEPASRLGNLADASETPYAKDSLGVTPAADAAHRLGTGEAEDEGKGHAAQGPEAAATPEAERAQVEAVGRKHAKAVACLRRLCDRDGVPWDAVCQCRSQMLADIEGAGIDQGSPRRVAITDAAVFARTVDGTDPSAPMDTSHFSPRVPIRGEGQIRDLIIRAADARAGRATGEGDRPFGPWDALSALDYVSSPESKVSLDDLAAANVTASATDARRDFCNALSAIGGGALGDGVSEETLRQSICEAMVYEVGRGCPEGAPESVRNAHFAAFQAALAADGDQTLLQREASRSLSRFSADRLEVSSQEFTNVLNPMAHVVARARAAGLSPSDILESYERGCAKQSRTAFSRLTATHDVAGIARARPSGRVSGWTWSGRDAAIDVARASGASDEWASQRGAERVAKGSTANRWSAVPRVAHGVAKTLTGFSTNRDKVAKRRAREVAGGSSKVKAQPRNWGDEMDILA